MIKLSQTTKMKIKGKKVASWSLNALQSCPGAYDSNNNIVEVCKSCYATKGRYRFKNVKATRDHNAIDYKKDDWTTRMIEECNKYDYIRMFDSGDIESNILAIKLYDVIRQLPKIKFWIPTRSDSITQLRNNVIKLGTLSNVSLRLSANNIGLKSERKGVNTFVINTEDIFEAKKQNIFICPVTTSFQTSCDTCTVCYKKNVKVAYLLH